MLLDPHPEEGPRPPSQRYDVPTFGLDSKRRLKSPAQNEKFYRRLQGREIRERGKINPLIKYDRSIGFAAWGFMACEYQTEKGILSTGQEKVSRELKDSGWNVCCALCGFRN